MKKIIFAIFALIVSGQLFAQAGGFPSRPKFQSVTVGGSPVATIIEGSFTATEATGCTGSPTMNVPYTIVGKTVTLNFGTTSFSCVTDGVGSLIFSGVPAAVLTAVAPTFTSPKSTVFTCTENGVLAYCDANINTSGQLNIVKSATSTSGGWTGTGAKLLQFGTATFRSY